MFLKLLPDQVMKYWDEIALSIVQAMPPHLDANLVRIQELFLIGEMDCWVSYTNNTIRTIVTTQFTIDPATDTPQLLIFSLSTVEDTYSETWREIRDALTKYARSRKCRYIIAYTSDDSLIDLAKRLGANHKWQLLSFEV